MRAARWIALADRGSLVGLGLGLLLLCAVDAGWAFRVGFLVVLVSTVAQIVFSHLAASVVEDQERAR
jgi:predicted membrane protein